MFIQIPPVIPDHELLRRIGAGSYGEVWLARGMTGAYRAVKIVFRSSFEDDRPFQRELEGIENFEPLSRVHPSQVNILHVGRSTAGDCFYYIMELADDVATGTAIDPANYQPHTLRAELKRRGLLPAEECIHLGRQLASALSCLHERGLVHRDVKPSNIIFVGGVPKLADPGLVAETGGEPSFVGTAGFVAPEGPGTPAADVYSLGKVLYEAATGFDRQEWPRFPEEEQRPDHDALLELNEVLLAACDPDAHCRYPSAQKMEADLAALMKGRSLRHEKFRSRLLRRATQVSFVVLALAVCGWLIRSLDFHRAGTTEQGLARLYQERGLELMEQGDFGLAALWFVEALATKPGTAPEERDLRVRIGSLLRRAPKLKRVWTHPAEVLFAQFESASSRVLTVSADHQARVWSLTDDRLNCPPLRHTTAILDAALSADGRRVVTVGSDGIAFLWDADTGRSIASQLQEERAVRHARFSPDGRLIATSAGEDVRLWATDTGVAAGSVRHGNPISQIAFSEDGQWLATGSNDGSVRVWRVQNLEAAGPVFHHGGGVLAMRFSADAGLLAISGAGLSVRIWDWRTGEAQGEERRPRTPEGSFDSLAFNPDSSAVLGAARSRRVYRWSTETGDEVASALEHADRVNLATYSPDGQFILTACNDGAARLWESTSGNLALAPMRHSEAVHWVAFSPNGRFIATASADRLCKIWDLAEPMSHSASFSHQDDVRRAGFSPDDGRIATASHDTTVRVWSADPGAPPSSTLLHPGRVREMRWSSDGSKIVTLSGDDAVQRWNAATFQAGPVMSHGAFVQYLALDPDSDLALTAGFDGVARVWNLADGTQRAPPLEHNSALTRAIFDPSGAIIATASADGEVRLWQTDSGRLLETVSANSVSVTDLDFDSAGRLAISYEDGSVVVFDVSTKQTSSMPRTHHREVFAIKFHPTEPVLFVASLDGSLSRWDIERNETKILSSHPGAIITLALSSDGRWIVTTSNQEPFARILDSLSGAPIAPPIRHSAIIYEAQFRPNGHAVLTAGADNQAIMWDLSPESRPLDLLKRQARLLSSAEIDRNHGLKALDAENYASLWNSHKPADSAWPPDQAKILRWHARQSELLEGLGQWFAAAFHLERSRLSDSSDPAIDKRLLRHKDFAGRFMKGGRENATLRARLPQRSPTAEKFQLDLSEFYNAALTPTWHASIPFEGPLHQVDLAAFTAGLFEVNGVKFDARGVVQLGSSMSRLQGLEYPERVNDIPIRQRAQRIHFLHAAAWSQSADGTIVGRLQVRYADGSRVQLPLVLGSNVRDWWVSPSESAGISSSSPAWIGSTPGAERLGYKVGLFKLSWQNPKPDAEIKHLDYISAMTACAPFLLAVTVE